MFLKPTFTLCCLLAPLAALQTSLNAADVLRGRSDASFRTFEIEVQNRQGEPVKEIKAFASLPTKRMPWFVVVVKTHGRSVTLLRGSINVGRIVIAKEVEIPLLHFEDAVVMMWKVEDVSAIRTENERIKKAKGGMAALTTTPDIVATLVLTQYIFK
jgi:hypothetical protein